MQTSTCRCFVIIVTEIDIHMWLDKCIIYLKVHYVNIGAKS